MFSMILAIGAIIAGIVFIGGNSRMVEISRKLRKNQSPDFASLLKTQYYIGGVGFILIGIFMLVLDNR